MMTIDGWSNKKLSELATYINGYAFKPDDWEKDGLPIVRIEQLKNPDASTDYFSGKLPQKNIIENGDLIFSWSASLFLSIWQHGQAALNQHLFKVIEKDSVDRVFLKLFIEFYLPELTKASHGSTMQHITRKELDRFDAPFPTSKSEQIKIADVLSKMDRAIEQTEALIAKQKRIEIGLMQDLLTRGIDEHGNIRSEQTHKFKDSRPLGRKIPVEWEVKQLGFLCELIKDGTHLPPARVAEGPLLLGVQNMVDGKLTKTPSDTRVPWDFYEQMHQNWKIQEEDVFLAIVGATIGKTCLAPTNFEPYTLQRSVALIRGKKGILHNRFLLQYLKSPFFQSIIHTKTNSTAQAGLYLSQIADFHFPVCPIEEQIAISSQLERINNLGDSYQRAGEKLRSLKTALMQDLLTGKKRITALLHDTEVVHG